MVMLIMHYNLPLYLRFMYLTPLFWIFNAIVKIMSSAIIIDKMHHGKRAYSILATVAGCSLFECIHNRWHGFKNFLAPDLESLWPQNFRQLSSMFRFDFYQLCKAVKTWTQCHCTTTMSVARQILWFSIWCQNLVAVDSSCNKVCWD